MQVRAFPVRNPSMRCRDWLMAGLGLVRLLFLAKSQSKFCNNERIQYICNKCYITAVIDMRYVIHKPSRVAPQNDKQTDLPTESHADYHSERQILE